MKRRPVVEPLRPGDAGVVAGDNQIRLEQFPCNLDIGEQALGRTEDESPHPQTVCTYYAVACVSVKRTVVASMPAAADAYLSAWNGSVMICPLSPLNGTSASPNLTRGR